MTALLWLAAELPRLGELWSNREGESAPAFPGTLEGQGRTFVAEGAEIRVGMEEFCPAFPLCLKTPPDVLHLICC